jgi:helicase SWR1
MEMSADVKLVNRDDDLDPPPAPVHQPHDAAVSEQPATPSAALTPDVKEEEQPATENGDDGSGGGVMARPAKRRKVEESTPRRSTSRAVSPPWKLAVAEGPTTIIIDGKRKSTRFNPNVPAPAAPVVNKRTTRGAASKAAQPNGTGKNGINHKASRSASTSIAASKSKASQPALRKAPSAASLKPSPKKPDRRKSSAANASSPITNGRTRSSGRGPGRPRRETLPSSGDTANDGFSTPMPSHQDNYFTTPNQFYSSSPETSFADGGPTPRLKLRLRRPAPPNRHPQHAPPPSMHPTFSEWLHNDDPLEGEEGQRMTEADVDAEAELRLRIVDAADHGVLRPDQCSVYLTEPAEEPPQQYGHFDHVVAHALYFRKLLVREVAEHRKVAKRLAQEAVEKWKEKFKKKSQEEIEEEERARTILRYKQVAKDVRDMWSLIRVEIDKERVAKWEEEQLLLGHKVMDNMFNQAQEILGRNNVETPSSFVSGDEASESGSEGDSAQSEEEEPATEEENMSSDSASEEEDAQDEDANLTTEQLLAKYGQLPDLPPAESSEVEAEDDDEEGEDDAAEEDNILEEDTRTPDPTPDRDLAMEDTGSPMNLVDNTAPAHVSTGNHPNDPYPHTNGVHKTDDKGEIRNGHTDLPDPAAVELEEVDDALLDSEDDGASESGSEAWSDDEELEEETASGSEEESETEAGVLGFLAPDEIQKIKVAAKAELQKEDQAPETKEPTTINGVNGNHEHYDESDGETNDMKPTTNGAPDVEMDDEPPVVIDEAADEEIQPAKSIEEHEPTEKPSSSKLVSRSRSRHSSSPPRTQIPSLLRGTLREYQHDGLDWLANLYDGTTNGILADEMGLGKTIQTIALLAWLAVEREVWGPHLVVVPTSVMLNWEMEFKKWCPGFKILTYYGDILERQRQRKGWLNDDKYNVVITSYQLILQDAMAFKRRGWQYLILDEAHNIKNFKSLRWQTLLNFRTERRLLLTGTPLQNNIDELWSLLYFLMPAGFAGEGRIAGLEEFTMALKNPTNQILEQGRQQLDAEAQKVVRKLHEVLRPYLLRRLKADVEKQMPGKYEHVVYCRLSKRQRQLYDGFMGRAETKATLQSGNYMSIINCLMSLRKVCNHPDLFETRQIVTSFAMRKSVAADFEIKDLLIRRRLCKNEDDERISLASLDLLLARRETMSTLHARKTQQIRATRPLEDLIARQTRRLNSLSKDRDSSMSSALAQMAEKENHALLNHLKTCLHLTRSRTQFLPVYGKGLIDQLSFDYEAEKFGARSLKKGKKRGWRSPLSPTLSSKWYRTQSETLLSLVPTLEARSELLEPLITKFSCVTPAVVASDLAPLTLSEKGVELVRRSPWAQNPDPFHEPRVRLSIAFPDKRLLQYDCGKLQRLAVLLRTLQAGGHRALIFTQMTKVLDILEQFLNIYGHRYLRLDGATKVEQRQILTDRFNNDPRILCFILSSRSGGLGINLTGADTVIFYDLDWNPAMDKQCQDRSHRIGQTRDVHIYKFVSEYTIEANILRKSNQKRLLDDVIIQKGDFTTDYFNRVTWRDAFDDIPVDEAGAAMDRVLGEAGPLGEKLEKVEDADDVLAAKVAQKEIVDEIHVDSEDFKEANATSSLATPLAGSAQETAEAEAAAKAEKELEGNRERRHVDEYLLEVCRGEFGSEPWRPPTERQRKKSKKGVDVHRVKSRKRR